MQTMSDEIKLKIKKIDLEFNPALTDETALEQYVESYFSNALAQKFPRMNDQLKRVIVNYLHPDKFHRADCILIRWKAFLKTHPTFDGIPMKALYNMSVQKTPFNVSEKSKPSKEILEEYAFMEKMENSFWVSWGLRRIQPTASTDLLSDYHHTVYLTEQELTDRFRYIDIREFAKNKFSLDVDLNTYFKGVTNPNLSASLIQYFFSTDSSKAKYFPKVCSNSNNAKIRENFLENIKTFCQNNTFRNSFLQQKVFSKHLVGVVQPNFVWLSNLVIFNENTLETIKDKLPYLGQFIFYLYKCIKELFKLSLFLSIELPFFLLVSIPRTINSLITLLLVDVDHLFSRNTHYLKIVVDELWKKYYSEEQLNAPIINKEPGLIYDSMIYSFCQTWLFFQSYKAGLTIENYQSMEDLVKSFDEYYDKNKNINNSINIFEHKFIKFFVKFSTSLSFLNLFTSNFGFQMSLDLLKQENFGFKSFLRTLCIPIAFCLNLATQMISQALNLIKDFLIFSFYALSTVALSAFWLAPSMLYNSIVSMCCSKHELKGNEHLKIN